MNGHASARADAAVVRCHGRDGGRGAGSQGMLTDDRYACHLELNFERNIALQASKLLIEIENGIFAINLSEILNSEKSHTT